MVSDFIEEYSGYLRLSSEEFERAGETFAKIRQEATEVIKYGENRVGHWTHDKFLGQIKQAAMTDDSSSILKFILQWNLSYGTPL